MNSHPSDTQPAESETSPAHKTTQNRLTNFAPSPVILLALLYSLLFTLISSWWSLRLPDGWFFSGYLQGDQPTYTAWMREVFERGNGLFYANPFDASPDAPRIFSNFGYLLLAWIHKVIPLDWPRLWELLRVIGGFTMAILLYRLILRFTNAANKISIDNPGGPPLFWFALALTGGGLAWLLAAFSPIEGSWLQRFIYIEDGRGTGVGYGWWLPNLFRQPLYPLETLYHACLYGAALAYLSQRTTLCLLLITLLWWMHPITATLATTILGFAALADFAAGERKRQVMIMLGLAVISALFLSYNRIFIASSPSGRSLIDQTLQLAAEPMHWQWTWQMWGFYLLSIPAILLNKSARTFLIQDPIGRFVLSWFIAVFFWTHNNWFLRNPVQPMHFTRGHMFLALIFFLIIFFGQTPRLLQKLQKPLIIIPAILILLLGSMDNLLFAARLMTVPPRQYHLVLSESQMGIIKALQEEPNPRSILCLDPLLAVQIAAQTKHLLVMGDRAVTPFYDQKAEELAFLFQQADTRILDKNNVSIVIVTKALLQQIPTTEGLKGYEAEDYGDYILLRKGATEVR